MDEDDTTPTTPSAGADEEDEAFPINLTINITKASMPDTCLQLLATCEEGSFFVDHVVVVENGLERADTAESEWKRDAGYAPVFPDLDEVRNQPLFPFKTHVI